MVGSARPTNEKAQTRRPARRRAFFVKPNQPNDPQTDPATVSLMWIVDRHILRRFLANFLLLFGLLFLFAAAIDLILNLDRFAAVAQEAAGENAAWPMVVVAFVRLALTYESPRIFQFYAYLHGLVAIGAMGFTLAGMHRWRELVALLASGVSMHRLAMPFLVGAFIISLAQLVNHEWFLPRLAPMLLRSPTQMANQAMEEFDVPLTAYGAHDRVLVQAPTYNPRTGTLVGPTFIGRDEQGRTVDRVWADRATWDAQRNGWALENGRVAKLPTADGPMAADDAASKPAEFYPPVVTPDMLLVRRYTQYASMLSLSQISMMLQNPAITDAPRLLRHRYARFSVVLVNLLALIITLPCFLLREPGNLLVQSAWCAAFAVPAMLMASIFMMMDLPGITPIVAVFLPVVILVPVALARVTYVKT